MAHHVMHGCKGSLKGCRDCVEFVEHGSAAEPPYVLVREASAHAFEHMLYEGMHKHLSALAPGIAPPDTGNVQLSSSVGKHILQQFMDLTDRAETHFEKHKLYEAMYKHLSPLVGAQLPRDAQRFLGGPIRLSSATVGDSAAIIKDFLAHAARLRLHFLRAQRPPPTQLPVHSGAGDADRLKQEKERISSANAAQEQALVKLAQIEACAPRPNIGPEELKAIAGAANLIGIVHGSIRSSSSSSSLASSLVASVAENPVIDLIDDPESSE
jgi:hypothetical protein